MEQGEYMSRRNKLSAGRLITCFSEEKLPFPAEGQHDSRAPGRPSKDRPSTFEFQCMLLNKMLCMNVSLLAEKDEILQSEASQVRLPGCLIPLGQSNE